MRLRRAVGSQSSKLRCLYWICAGWVCKRFSGQVRAEWLFYSNRPHRPPQGIPSRWTRRCRRSGLWFLISVVILTYILYTYRYMLGVAQIQCLTHVAHTHAYTCSSHIKHTNYDVIQHTNTLLCALSSGSWRRLSGFPTWGRSQSCSLLPRRSPRPSNGHLQGVWIAQGFWQGGRFHWQARISLVRHVESEGLPDRAGCHYAHRVLCGSNSLYSRPGPIATKSTRLFQIWKRPSRMTWWSRTAERWRWYPSGWAWSSLKHSSALWPVSLRLRSGLVWCGALLAGVSCMFQGFMPFNLLR